MKNTNKSKEYGVNTKQNEKKLDTKKIKTDSKMATQKSMFPSAHFPNS